MEVKKEVDEVSSMFSQDTTEVSQRKHEWCHIKQDERDREQV